MDPAKAEQRYPHATRARFVFAQCRCLPCKVANSEYVRAVSAAKRNPWQIKYCPAADRYCVRNAETKEIRLRTKIKAIAIRLRDALNKSIPSEFDGERIDNIRARKHILRLQARGIGYNTIAMRADINPRTVWDVAKGRVTQSSRSTVDAILGVTGEPRGSALVDATSTWILLNELLARGFSRSSIARGLGQRKFSVNATGLVAAKTADKVRALHARVIELDLRKMQLI